MGEHQIGVRCFALFKAPSQMEHRETKTIEGMRLPRDYTVAVLHSAPGVATPFLRPHVPC